MAEPGLSDRAATHGLVLPGRVGALDVRETPMTGKWVLRCEHRLAQSLSAVIGVGLDEPVNRAAVAGEFASLRLGPDEWLLLAHGSAAEEMTGKLLGRADSDGFSLVDVGHRTAALEFTGTAAADVLASGCPLPLAGDRFPPGKCTRTVFAKAEITLWRRDEQRYHVEIQRSCVPYVLALAAIEIAAA